MHTSPLSKEFYNSISDVLMGKTTTKLVLPASLVDSANKARKELKQSFLSEGFVSLEARRDILRKNLKEGADTCGCTLTAQMVSRFSEMAGEAVAEEVVPEEVVAEEVVAESETEEAVEEITEITESTIEFMLDKKVVLKKTMKDGEAKRAGDKWTKSGILPFQFNKERAEKYRIPWKTELVDGGVQWGPGYKKGQKRDAVIGAKKSFESVEHGEEVEIADTDTITDAITEADHIIEVTNTLTDFVKELNVDEVRILKNLLNNH